MKLSQVLLLIIFTCAIFDENDMDWLCFGQSGPSFILLYFAAMPKEKKARTVIGGYRSIDCSFVGIIYVSR